MPASGFTPAVLDHFHNPRNAGELSGADAVIEVTNPVCGDILRLSVRREGNRIAAIAFKAQGCVTAIASGSILTDLAVHRTFDEAAAITAENISDALGGLPPTTIHGSQLAAEGLRSLLARLRG